MAHTGKEQIIEAAKRVISQHGIKGATMRGIAEEAQISTGAIYHYYKSKEEILYDIMDESLSESTRIAIKARESNLDKNAIIEEIYENIRERFAKNDENYIQFYLAQEAMLGNPELQAQFKEKYSEWIGRTQELLCTLYQKPDCAYTTAISTLLIGAIDGVVMQALLSANPASLDEVSEVYHLLLQEGIPRFIDLANEKLKK